MDLGFANPYGTHTALSAVQNMGGQVRPGATPAPDRGASVGNQNSDADTANVFYGSSQDKATSWRVHRGAGQSVNAAYAGQGNITMSQPTQPARVQEM